MIWPSDANLVPGPIEPATHTPYSSATLRAMAALAREISWSRSAMPYSPSGIENDAERVGLDDVDTELAVGAVELLDHVGPGDAEDLVAALELRTAEVVGREVLLLQPGAGGAVVDDDARLHGLEKGFAHGQEVTGGARVVSPLWP